MLKKIYSRRLLLALVTAGVISGCSTTRPTPTMPTYPARIGGSSGVTANEDAICRQRAYQAAQAAKDSNVATEVGSTVVGVAIGAALGNALEPGHHRGPRPPGPGGPGGPGGPPGRPSDPGWGTAGGITGGVAGAAASQSMIQNTQQVYDTTYNNCIAAYVNYGR